MLNIVLSSQKEFFDNIKIYEPLGCSDDNHIYVIIKVKAVRNRTLRYRKTSHKGRYKDMGEYLAKIDWNNTLKNKTATGFWNNLKSEIDCVDKFVSFKNRGNGQRRNTYRRKPLEYKHHE